MGIVLNEAHFQFEWVDMLPIVFLVILIFFPKILERTHLRSGKELSSAAKQLVRGFCICAGIFVGAIGVILAVTTADMYAKTVTAYHRGEYEIVEGYVENFHPMPDTGRSNESFKINGIFFSYSDYEIQQGYHNARSHGGVIEGDGQYLKIGYVQLYLNSEYRNVIVYIEELPPPS